MINEIQQIESDLEWREAELASFRKLLGSSRKGSIERRALIRAAWSLLYAHYEGFTKFSLTVFFDFLSERGETCRTLCSPTIALALRKEINSIKSMSEHEALISIIRFQKTLFDKQLSFPEVDTKSNLWPEVLIELTSQAGISLQLAQRYRNSLKTLVARRNSIAHGERELIEDIDYYLEFEDKVTDLMVELVLEIDQEIERILGT